VTEPGQVHEYFITVHFSSPEPPTHVRATVERAIERLFHEGEETPGPAGTNLLALFSTSARRGTLAGKGLAKQIDQMRREYRLVPKMPDEHARTVLMAATMWAEAEKKGGNFTSSLRMMYRDSLLSAIENRNEYALENEGIIPREYEWIDEMEQERLRMQGFSNRMTKDVPEYYEASEGSQESIVEEWANDLMSREPERVAKALGYAAEWEEYRHPELRSCTALNQPIRMLFAMIEEFCLALMNADMSYVEMKPVSPPSAPVRSRAKELKDARKPGLPND